MNCWGRRQQENGKIRADNKTEREERNSFDSGGLVGVDFKPGPTSNPPAYTPLSCPPAAGISFLTLAAGVCGPTLGLFLLLCLSLFVFRKTLRFIFWDFSFVYYVIIFYFSVFLLVYCNKYRDATQSCFDPNFILFGTQFGYFFSIFTKVKFHWILFFKFDLILPEIKNKYLLNIIAFIFFEQ